MTVAELHTQIIEKRLDDVYIVTGEELEVRSQYIHKIAEVAGLTLVVKDSFSEVATKLRSNSFIVSRYCYIIWEDREFLSVDDGLRKVKQLVGNNLIIFVYNNIDKRSKFYKQNKDIIVDFEHLQPHILLKYIKKHIELSDSNAEKLMQICENDYSRILLEIDKIIHYKQGSFNGSNGLYDVECDDAFKELLEANAIYQPPKDAIFDFVDAVLNRQVARVYDCLDNCKRIGESTLALLSVLYSNTKQVLQVQSYKGNDIAGSTGLTQWQIKSAQAKRGKYRNSELVELMRRARNMEIGIKTGTIEEDFAIDYLLANTL